MDAIENLLQRRSIRQFTSQPVEPEKITQILDCARHAASARNVQPWQFVVIADQATRQQIANWAPNGHFLDQCPICIAVFCKDTRYYLEDGSAATQNILLAAHALGLGSCWIAGDKKEHAEPVGKLLEAPENHKLVSLIALGYPDQQPAPSKRPLAGMVHHERFDRSILKNESS